MRLLWRSGGFVALAFVAGCGTSVEEVVRAHGEKARAKLVQVKKVLDDVRSRAPLEGDEVPEGGKGVVFSDFEKRPSGNARTIWLDAYDRPGETVARHHWSYVEQDRWWFWTSDALSERRRKYEKKEVKELNAAFGALGETEYVCVVKTRTYRAPEYLRDLDSYRMASLEGEAHLVRLSDGRRVGAVRFEVSDETIGYAGIDFTLVSDTPEGNVRSLEERFYPKILQAAEGTLAARCGGVDSLHRK